MNVPGQWIFRVGQIDGEAEIEEPDMNNSGKFDYIFKC